MRDEIEQLTSTPVYTNRWMTVREDTIRRADNTEGIYGIVDKVDYSLVIPYDGERVHLVEQFRYPVGGRFWEFPQGAWETLPDADPADVAAGELAEETGFTAGKIVKLGALFQASGYSNQSIHVYLATDLSPGERRPEPEEQGMRQGTFDLDELRRMIADAAIRDVASVAATYFLLAHLDTTARPVIGGSTLPGQV